MHKDIPWSYRPYKPFLFDVGEPYVCRLVPGETNIHLEWLPGGEGLYTVQYRPRGDELFTVCGTTEETSYTIGGLKTDVDYEVQVTAGTCHSRVRLAHTGKVEGTAVNYLHPEDTAYSFSGRFLCSPSLVRHPEGYLLASMDVHAGHQPQNLTLIFRSDDEGATWHYVSELMPCFWGKMFIHKGALYMIACSTEYGDLLIGRSDDGGKTFPECTVLLRGACKTDWPGVHKNPQPVIRHKGRLYNTLEWGAWHCGYHAPMVMSCDENADLLDANNWHITPPVPYDPSWPGVAKGPTVGNIEGALAVAPDGRLLNIMRYDTSKTTPNYGLVLAYEVNTEDPDAPLTYSHAIPFPGNLSKFSIHQDPLTGQYYTIASRITDPQKSGARNLLSLMVSDDLLHWRVARDLIDYRHCDPRKVGFQYVDFMIEGDDILFLCRTAMNGADSFHNSNYSTFHRVKDFRT